MVPFKYETSVEINADQFFFKNSFTVQTEGESCTFMCANQKELQNLYSKIKKQRDAAKEATFTKLKLIFENEGLQNC